MQLGSLFDGSGGFPLSGALCGIEPVWASEVEPFPIAVTWSRFPNMKHLGSVTNVHGDKIEPVDIITFGSPCQDLSVAGKRAGLKHEANGDEETTRSGLFMEAVRIIKEMRRATNGVYPRFAVWENVPGAFSSNKGEDFRIVCEELIKIVEPSASMPSVPQKGWPYSDSYIGDGWSLAYRVFDAQYWGVPQRRRRIYLVVDFRGECAREILFEREGLRGYFEEGRTPWQTVTRDAEGCPGTADCETDGVVPYTLKIRSGCEGGGKGALIQTDKSATLSTLNDQYLFQPVGCLASSAVNAEITDGDISPCLMARAGTGGNQLPLVAVYDARGNGDGQTVNTITGGDRHAVAYCIGNGQLNQITMAEQANTLDCMHDQQAVLQPVGTFQNTGIGWWNESPVGATVRTPCGGDSTMANVVVAGVDCQNMNETPKLYPTLQAKDNGGQSLNYSGAVRTRYIVRRLTPTECARLQGFADRWAVPVSKDDFTDEEYAFWLNVRNTHAEINGKATKDYTKDQMLSWYNKLHTDSAEYKLWGNGIALPTALYVLQGIADVKEDDNA